MADPLELILTTNTCRDVIEMLVKRRRWSLPRIARVIGRPVEYVQHIHARKQSFQMSDVEAISKACKVRPSRLLFDSFGPEMFPKGLYELGRREIERAEGFSRAMARKPAKKRRVRAKAA